MKLIIRNLNNTKQKIKEEFPQAAEETIDFLIKDLNELQKVFFTGNYPLMRLVIVMMKRIGVEVVIKKEYSSIPEDAGFVINELLNEWTSSSKSERIKRGKAHE